MDVKRGDADITFFQLANEFITRRRGERLEGDYKNGDIAILEATGKMHQGTLGAPRVKFRDNKTDSHELFAV